MSPPRCPHHPGARTPRSARQCSGLGRRGPDTDTLGGGRPGGTVLAQLSRRTSFQSWRPGVRGRHGAPPEPTPRPPRPRRGRRPGAVGEGSRGHAIPGAAAARALSSHADSPQVDAALVCWKPTRRLSAGSRHGSTPARLRSAQTLADSGRVTRHLSACTSARPGRPCTPATYHSGRLRRAAPERFAGKRCWWEPPTPPHSASRLRLFAPEAWDPPEVTEKHFRGRCEPRDAAQASAAEARR